ncbi:MAG: SagB/ThcOx family dehydrogenase [Actinobacteria bacterium]|nr:SagB/ThcOx family dehydrogenase [Actinomycetota bacterium]
MIEHPGKTFQQETSYHRDSIQDLEEHGLDWRSKPPLYKFYSHAPVVSLPNPAHTPDEDPPLDLFTCVARRRSVRSFGATPISMLELSRLLWASVGITASFITPHGQDFYRASPTAGALYPVETYVVVNKVEDLEPGLYHYRVAGIDILERPIAEGSHSLELVRAGDLRSEISAAALDQAMCGRAGAVILYTAVFARSVWKYRERAYRYFYLDAGHIAAQLSLAAVAQGLGSCPIAAFYDDEVNALLGVDGETEGIVYMTAVGKPSRPFTSKADVRHTARPKE